MRRPNLVASLIAVTGVVPVTAQMEKRAGELFGRAAFEAQAPALAAEVPDLALETIGGRPWSLLQRLGKTVVLVKASFT
ncbi:MAG: hypothetical protein AAF196_00230 [Planctomycetota bacterium]